MTATKLQKSDEYQCSWCDGITKRQQKPFFLFVDYLTEKYEVAWLGILHHVSLLSLLIYCTSFIYKRFHVNFLLACLLLVNINDNMTLPLGARAFVVVYLAKQFCKFWSMQNCVWMRCTWDIYHRKCIFLDNEAQAKCNK